MGGILFSSGPIWPGNYASLWSNLARELSTEASCQWYSFDHMHCWIQVYGENSHSRAFRFGQSWQGNSAQKHHVSLSMA